MAAWARPKPPEARGPLVAGDETAVTETKEARPPAPHTRRKGRRNHYPRRGAVWRRQGTYSTRSADTGN